jgi:hypothetical protein
MARPMTISKRPLLSAVKCFSLIAVFTCPALSQGYYPLAIGDRWDRGELGFPGESPFTYSVVITAETTMANGKTYAVMQTVYKGTFGRKEFHRQEGPLVYTFTDTSEVAWMDFRYADGDTVGSWITETDTVLTTVSVSEGMTWGRWLRGWIFSNFRVNDPGLYESGWWSVIDSIGSGGFFFSPGYSEHLFGAIISGKVYGTITDVEPDEDRALLPGAPLLLDVYPNPFNDAARISFSMPPAARFDLSLYDALGRKVRSVAEGSSTSGHETFLYQSRGLSSGLYFLRLTAVPPEPGSRPLGQVKRIMLLR